MFSWVCCLKTWKPKVSLIKFVKKLVLLVKSSIVPLLTTTQLLDDTMVATSGPMDTFRKMDTRVSAWVELLKQGWHWRGNQSSKTIPVDERKPLLRFFVACFSRRNRSDSDGSLIASQCLICMLQEPCWWNTGLKQRYPATGISPTVTFTRCRWSLLSQSRNLVTGARRNGIPKAQMAWCFFLIHTVLSYYIMTKETMMIWGYNGREGSAYILCLYSVDTVYLSPYESWDSQRIDSFVHGNNVGISLINWGGEETDPPVFWLSKWTYDQWAPVGILSWLVARITRDYSIWPWNRYS